MSFQFRSRAKLKVNIYNCKRAGVGMLTETNKVLVGVVCFPIPLIEILKAGFNGIQRFNKLSMHSHIGPGLLQEFEDWDSTPDSRVT